MTRKKKQLDKEYRYFTDTVQKMEFRRKGLEWPEFRPMRIDAPQTTLEVMANVLLVGEMGAFVPVPEHLMDRVPEF